MQVAALGLNELFSTAPTTILSLRQATVNAFAALLANHTSALRAPSLRASANLVNTSTDLAIAAATSPGFIQAMRFLAAHVQRAPPSVLPAGFATDCMLQLCAPWTPDRPAERRELLTAFATATDLSIDGEQCVSPPEPLLERLLALRQFPAATALLWKLGNVTAALEAGLQHCEALAALAVDLTALGSTLLSQHAELAADAAVLADAPVGCEWSDLTAGDAAAAVQSGLQGKLEAWFDAVEPLLRGGSRQQGTGDAAAAVFAQHFAFLCALETSMRAAAGSTRCVAHLLPPPRWESHHLGELS